MLISVVIPCYNAQYFIGDALKSVINQTYSNFEIICVNDGSTDDTLNVLYQYRDKYPDKIIVIDSVNKGAPHARNVGIAYAKGELIQFFDADDLLDIYKFEIQSSYFKNKEIDIVVSDRISKDEQFIKTINSYKFEEIERFPLNTVISKILITGNPLYKKDFIVKIGMWDESLPNTQDWDLNLRAVLSGANIKYVSGNFLITRVVRNSLSSNWKNVSKTKEKLILKYWNQINNKAEKLNEDSLREIFHVFYNNLIFSNSKTEFNKCFKNYKIILPNYYYLPFYEKIVIKMIGFKTFLFLKRLLLKKLK